MENIIDWEISNIEKLYKSIIIKESLISISSIVFIHAVIELRIKRDKLFPDKRLPVCDETDLKMAITNPRKPDKAPQLIGKDGQTKKWNKCWGKEVVVVSENNLTVYYVGDFREGEFNGRGTIIYSDGQVFHGEFKNGLKNGYGACFFKNGTKYIGEVKDDLYIKGTYTYANGDKYVGEWKENKQHGQGTLTFDDGSKYVGNYKDGKQHGQGTFTTADGTVYKGIWENNELVKPN